tara:strand:- start:171 stop:557 length:387 start_codon:yes stop_codon:yes gene_type:complete
MSYREKYLKYKQKYLDLKKELEKNNLENLTGGFDENSEIEEFDYKLSTENDIDNNSIDELKQQLNDLEGGADFTEDFDFDIKLDDEDDLEIEDELTDLDELFDKIDEDDTLNAKEFKELNDFDTFEDL